MSVDTDEQVDVDIDLTVPCQAVGCDSEATWHGEGLCPAGHKNTLVICDVHQFEFRVLEVRNGWVCREHFVPMSRFSWRRL